MARVLVADDEPAIRDVIESTCRLDAHEVLAVPTSEAAVDAYATFRPDLMILDRNMPGGGAEQILAEIDRKGGDEICPVIVVSGFNSDEADHERIVEVIHKPFGIDALRIAVKTALSATRAT